MLTDVRNEQVDFLMVASDTHGNKGGFMCDGAGLDRSSISYIESYGLTKCRSWYVEFVD